MPELPLWARSPEQVVGYLDAVQVLEQRLAGLKLRLVREVDSLGVPQKQGAASTVSWLRDRHRVSGGAAKRAVELARALDSEVPAVAAALDAGAVNVEQARLIAATVDRVPARSRARRRPAWSATRTRSHPKNSAGWPNGSWNTSTPNWPNNNRSARSRPPNGTRTAGEN